MPERWRVLPMGDRAVLVECSDRDEAAAAALALSEHPAPGQRELVPGARSVLVVGNDGADIDTMTSHLGSLAPRDAPYSSAVESVTVDVLYDGPDLAEVAALTGLGVDGVVAAHTGSPWRVAFTGFAPGFGYLVGGDPRLRVPRRETPRPEVPAGSVGLAGEFSGVYPRVSPGGWQLVGRTDAPLWDERRDPPALLRPGTVVHFRAVRQLSRAGSTGGGGAVVGSPHAGGGAVVGSPHARQDLSSTSRLGEAADPAPGQHDAGRVLTVVRPGISCLIQDLGRPGLAAQGVSRSGAADRAAARRANRIVGNGVDAAVLELIPGRVQVRAGGPMLVAVTGALAPVQVDGADRRRDTPIPLPAGATLTVGPPSAGLRCYLAVRGGIAVPPVLHSRSTDLLAGIGPRPVRVGEMLPIGEDHWGAPHAVSPPPGPGAPSGEGTSERGSAADRIADDGDDVEAVGIGVLPGPQADWFSGGVTALAGTTWRVLPASNRIGIRLDGPPLARAMIGEVPSQGLVSGAVQVPPDGRPVIMLVDHPVTGGYPVVGVVATVDLDVLAQLRPGAAVRFVTAGSSVPAATSG